MNIFHDRNGKLDREYLRICAVCRLLMRQKRIDRQTACDLLAQRNVTKPERLVSFWLGNPKQGFAS